MAAARVSLSTQPVRAMKTYHGRRLPNRRCAIDVQVDGAPASYPLPHRVRHSPTGFEWGYAGSGPADTARSLLAEELGYVPHLSVYQKFKARVVAKWQGDWTLTSEEIVDALAVIAGRLQLRCLCCADEAILFDEHEPGEDAAYCAQCARGRALAAEEGQVSPASTGADDGQGAD